MESSLADGIRWHPRVTVERYSPDQTAWAQGILDRSRDARGCMVTGTGIAVSELHGDLLRDLFPRGPEDGYAHDEGNQLVNAGLANLINLITGAAASGSTGRPLSLGVGGGLANAACVGVGTDGTTAFALTQTHLANATGEGGPNSWYQSMDTGYPTLSTPATINGQSTFAAGNANFAWMEWCWVSGAGVPTAGAVLGSVYATAGSAAMLNRKIPAGGLGSKLAGAAWVFQTATTLSLLLALAVQRRACRFCRHEPSRDHRRPGAGRRRGVVGAGRPGLPGDGERGVGQRDPGRLLRPAVAA